MANQENAATAPPKDSGKMLSLVFALVNFVVIGLGAFLTYSSTLGVVQKSTGEEEILREMASFDESIRKDPVMFSLGTFNTNLNGVPKRMIRVQVNLEMLDEEGFEEVVGLGAEAKDSVIRILNAKSFSQIETVQGKLYLKNEIVTDINKFLDNGVVKNIYFTDFAVQAH